MNGRTYAFLDIVALPAVGAVLLDPRPALVFRGDGSAVLWANAAGVAFFGEVSMGALLERRFAAGSPMASQIAKLAKQLPGDHPRLEMVRFSFGVRQIALASSCRRLDLGSGAKAVLVVGVAEGSRESLGTRAERFADTIAGEEGLAAVLDADGKVLGASGGFDVLSPASAEIDALIGELVDRDRRVVKRALAVNGGARPAGVVRVPVGDDHLFVLFVGPEERAADHEPVGKPAESSRPVAPPAPSPEPVGKNPPPPPPPTAPPPLAPPVATGPPTQAAPRTLRFLWQSDADGRFVFVSGELASVVGPHGAVSGQTFGDIDRRLHLDPDGRVGAALLRGASWSGLTVWWPVSGSNERIAIELSAVAIGAQGSPSGFRGFGTIRLDERIADPHPPSLPAPATPAPPVLDDASPATSAAAPVTPGEDVEEDIDDWARKSIEQGTPPPREEDAGHVPAEARPATPARAKKKAEDAVSRSNVVHLKATPTRILPRRLTGTEQDAFRRIAEALGARNENESETPEPAPPAAPAETEVADTRLIDKLSIGVLVYRDKKPLYANRAFLDFLGYESLAELIGAGGTEAIFAEGDGAALVSGGAITARRRGGSTIEVDAKLHAVPWGATTALMLSLSRRPEPTPATEPAKTERALADRVAELETILDTATDGVIVIDRSGRISNFNQAAEALFGVTADSVAGKAFTDLLAEESRKAALDYLDGLSANGVASVLNDGREVIGRVPKGGLIPLFMTVGRLGDSGKYCAVLRDITHWKNVEEELVAARKAAETANAQKSDFLAKISHEIRTPLNAIIGFSEVMMEERFGPIGSERYRDYLRDIHLSGEHLMSLINDLLDLSKIEAGKLELHFESVAVNEVIQECVALMQPQANRERIIIRTSLAAGVPNVVADLRALRQILLNLLSNAIKFTKAGGQVIVATALEENGEVVIRIRDTGIGMSEKDIETAMKPFRQIATSGREREGTGLGLPLTKALVEANRASFSLDSVPNQGTLVRITFPTTRVLAG